MIGSHFTLIQIAERLHRHFLDVLRAEMERQSVTDLSPVDALLLANIAEDDVGIDELPERGYYGSNVVKLIEGLTEKGYLNEEKCPTRGIPRLRLTAKGHKFYAVIRGLQEHMSADLDRTGLKAEDLFTAIDTLEMVERTWTDYMDGIRPANTQ